MASAFSYIHRILQMTAGKVSTNIKATIGQITIFSRIFQFVDRPSTIAAHTNMPAIISFIHPFTIMTICMLSVISICFRFIEIHTHPHCSEYANVMNIYRMRALVLSKSISPAKIGTRNSQSICFQRVFFGVVLLFLLLLLLLFVPMSLKPFILQLLTASIRTRKVNKQTSEQASRK